MANTILSPVVWNTTLAGRLDKPQNWKDVCDVIYTTRQGIVFPAVTASDEPAVTANQFAAAASRSDMSLVVPFVSVTETSQTLSIVTTDIDNVYIDQADEAQSDFTKVVDMANLLSKKISERVETNVLANHAAWTNLGDDGTGAIDLATTNITVTQNNIDDIVSAVIREIQDANGFDLYMKNGGFITWRPSDWEKLVKFMQANGYSFADEALKTGGRIGKEALGLFHYVSTSHASNHLMAGVRKTQKLGLLSSTYGKANIVKYPASSTAGFMPGTSVYHRLDYGLLVLTHEKPCLFDVNVA